MSQLPLNLPTLSDEETKEIRSNFDRIRNILVGKFINLEPEDRSRYGSINEKNKLVVNKVGEYNLNMPSLSSPKVDWDTYRIHAKTRSNYKLVTDMLHELNELCDDPRILVDYVLFGLARQDYKWTKFNAADDGGSAGGFEAKYTDIKQFFLRDTDDDSTPPQTAG